MTVDVDPFADDPITRDHYGRALIIPIKRGKPDTKAKLVGYTRVSTFCDALSEAGGLVKWSLWHLALGLGRNPDLAALAGVFGPTVDDLSRADKQALDAIIERAHDRSGGNAKADYGTVVHAYTEPGAQDVPDPFDEDTAVALRHSELLADLARDTAAYHATMQAYGLETVDTEQFVVNDEVQSAGTYDHQVRLSRDLAFTSGDNTVTLPAGTVLVLDKKTGKLHFDSQCIQLAVYANAKRYDPQTGERSDLGVSTDWAVLAHIPKGQARCDLYLVDLRVGWAAAKLAQKVREHRTRKNIALPFPALDSGNAEIPPATESADSPKVDVEAPAEAPTDTVLGMPVVVDDGFPADTVSIANDGVEVAVVKVDDPWAESPIDEPPTDPIEPIAEPETVEDAVANLAGAGIVDEIHADIFKAKTRLELKAAWSKHKADWTDEHTAIVEGRLADMAA